MKLVTVCRLKIMHCVFGNVRTRSVELLIIWITHQVEVTKRYYTPGYGRYIPRCCVSFSSYWSHCTKVWD